MLAVYQRLEQLGLTEFGDVVTGSIFLGGTPASPNKLRLRIVDGSFLDVWLSADGDYAYHWEHRRVTGRLYRWDNAPHHRAVATFPDHFHDGEENVVVSSDLSQEPEVALRQVLSFVRSRTV